MFFNKSFISFLFFLSLSVFVFSAQFDGFKGKCEIEQIREDEDREIWKNKILKIRKEKNISFKNDDTSPLAGKVRLIALKDTKYYLNKTKNSFVFLKKRDKKSLFSVKFNEKWIFDDVLSSVKCFKDTVEIKSGDKLEYKSKIKFDKYTLIIYPLEKYLIATLFDPDRHIIKNFSSLKYYPVNENFFVDAKIEKIKNPEKVIMLTSRNLEKTFYRSSKISFKINNKQYTLFAYSSKISNVDYLFIPFTDKTTGKGSYYSGRYLELPFPKNKTFKLDFNLAFNPLCNYSPAYNCAIPPEENELKIKIEAGEKTYPVKDY